MNGPAVLEDASDLSRLRPGDRVWLRVRGRCMEPIIRSGDVLEIEACGAEAIARGDVAAVRHEDGTYRAHLVISLGPVRTGTLAGDRDAGRLEVLGRVRAIRSERSTLRLGPTARHALWAAWLVARAASRTGVRARARRAVEAAALSPAGKHFRERLWGPFEVRVLTLADSGDVAHFAASQGLMEPRLATQLLRTRWIRPEAIALGAFDRRGRMVGLAVAEAVTGDGRLTLSQFQLRRAVRRMGLGAKLAAELDAVASSRQLPWLEDAQARTRVAAAFDE